MEHGRSKNRLMISLAAAIVSFSVTMGISFFLTPFLVQRLGTEAYGFIGLANNFVQYATIVTAALNSMSGRFISIAYHKGDLKKASSIFSSVLVADLIMASVMLLLGIIVVLRIDSLLNIPSELVMTVRITFSLTFLAYLISIITAVFTTAAYVKNRIDISSVRDIIAHLLKALIIIALFAFFPARLYYVALATVGSGLFLLFANITVKKKLLPDIHTSFRDFKMSEVRVLIASGVWMSLIQLSNTLITGVDLLICNLSVGAVMMGLMSIAKTIPTSISILITTVAQVFAPKYTILYAQGKINELIGEVNRTQRLQSFLLTIPIAGFLVYGRSFYQLWQPDKSPEEITVICVISFVSCLMYMFMAHTQTMTLLFSVCNRLRLPVLVSAGIGVFSVIAVIVCLSTGTYDEAVKAYLIAGISSFLMIFRALLFVPMYAAHILNQKRSTFYPVIIRSVLTFLVVSVLFLGMKQLFAITGWGSLVIACALSAAAGYCLSLFILFGRDERRALLSSVLRRIRR